MLLESLGGNEVKVLCHDSETESWVRNLGKSNIQVIDYGQISVAFPELDLARSNRTLLEFYFLLTPYLIKWLFLEFNPTIAVYVDADTYFFSDPTNVLDLFDSKNSVAIVPHRFSARDKYMEKYGKYNVGWLAFRNDTEGNTVLNFWMTSCLNSTSKVASESIFGDQKYLDLFQEISTSTQVIVHAGVNAAPWNCRNVKIIGDVIYIEDEPLYLYHYSGLKRFNFFYVIGFADYSKRPSRAIKRYIYKPYIKGLEKINSGFISSHKISNIGIKGWVRELFYLDTIRK